MSISFDRLCSHTSFGHDGPCLDQTMRQITRPVETLSSPYRAGDDALGSSRDAFVRRQPTASWLRHLRCARRDKAPLIREDHHLYPVAERQLREETGHMGLHCRFRDADDGGDLGVRQTAGDLR
jgi:hypothetical protein